MSEPAPPSTTDALDALVHQFADPLAFFRELVQNAIDAGSAEVDVQVQYQDGVLEIRFDDYGEGMDRAIIDTRLTRLFSSSKEGDQTKIGRFGIGFVSVFALAPDAVVVDTARGGECWRVLFREDRSFERIALRAPVDGTKIRILKRTGPALYEEVRRRAPEVLARYCRHAEVEIRFHGRVLNEPFDLESPCKLTAREAGSELVVGYAPGEAFAGYYNRGLMLLEEARPAQLYSFKINSPQLEHTLARDNLLRDERHDALIEQVRELGERKLPALLFERLEQAIAADTERATIDALWRLAARQIQAWGGAGGDGFQAVARRHVARAIDGKGVSLRALARLGGAQASYVATHPTPVAEALRASGTLVLHAAPDGALPALLAALGCEPCAVGTAFCLSRAVDERETRASRRLAAAVLALLQKGGAALREVRVAQLEDRASVGGRRLAILQRAIGELTPMNQACRSPLEAGDRDELVFNVEHPGYARLAALAEHEPELAAHLACKLLLVGGALSPLQDSRFALHALEARWRRSTS